MILNKKLNKSKGASVKRRIASKEGLIKKETKPKRGKIRRRLTLNELVKEARKMKKTLGSEVETLNSENRRGKAIVSGERRKSSRKNQSDQELIEKYGNVIVDLTDLAAWGEFESDYHEPTGAREKRKMLKKTSKSQKQNAKDESDDYFDDESDRSDADDLEDEGDEDAEEFMRQMETHGVRGEMDHNADGSEKKGLNDNEGDEVDENDGNIDIDDNDESIEDGESEPEANEMTGDLNDKDGSELIGQMPFKGPLALPKKEGKVPIKRKPFSVLDDGDSDEEGKDNGSEAMDTDGVRESNMRKNDQTENGITVAKRIKGQQKLVEEKHVEDTAELSLTERNAVKNWEPFPIHDCILKALARLKYTEPTEIQSECLTPAIRDRLDIFGAAETGSGKTLAFGIPIVNRLLDDKKRNKMGALVLTPTRELAVQIKKHLTDITEFTSLHVVTIVGGLCHEKQIRLIRKRPEIIVATPGRLFEFLQDDPSFQEQLTNIRCLVIDEADRMVQEGHFDEMKLILKFMNQNQQRKRQNLVFSATLTMDPHLPDRVMEKKKGKKVSRLDQLKTLLNMSKPKIIDLSKRIGTAEKLTESRIFCEKPEQKDALLYYFLCMHPGRTLVFCNSIDCVKRLKSVLETLLLHPMALHSEMQQRQRLRHLDKFATQPNSLLIATDVAARGLDIKNVEHVIHFNVSKASEMYIHRSGRTARIKQDGLSIMLVDGRELPQYRRLLHALKREEDLPAFPIQENILKVCKIRVAKARELEALDHRQRKRSKNNRWFAKCAKEADIQLDEDLLQQTDWTGDRKERMKMEKLQHELKILLRKRLIPLNQRVGEALQLPDKDPLKLVQGSRGVPV
ncbi:ATP-dependent RNA helicase DDX24-like [Varroa destructor]|uniref:RNA helicase n=1 Tax=Varroa destructor TaxID=109461 RepID=A0A7M7JJ81_VARDE|nr:ATP-dependent RNA helicase DDX24-like [Varroa destructor]XP_022652342.1 ATP-dependent RNA helicase DDX24-like [Varroa destructor]XP_022652343.1 ATP-dependent RNA helicase DDX24-like [Varroa destructor]XP_022652344.1 ATP-dependent RNA helicase DDX24-like [Varroa destructor]XP_022652345.1 ATP-dependent RNA helicase DDX24-like [Varroa destructor]XP_022652346.1 ATP-dependent RNA helicase DDX24-like [Varroa destructor]